MKVVTLLRGARGYKAGNAEEIPWVDACIGASVLGRGTIVSSDGGLRERAAFVATKLRFDTTILSLDEWLSRSPSPARLCWRLGCLWRPPL